MPNENFPSIREFLEAAERAADAGRTVHLALNAPLYSADSWEVGLGIADAVVGRPGVAGIIVADPAMVVELHRRFPACPLTASTVLGLTNEAAVARFKTLGIRRVVVPRSLAIPEVARLVRAHPDIAFECFVLNDRCPNVDAVCGFVHGFPGVRFDYQVSICRCSVFGEGAPGDADDGARAGGGFGENLVFEREACGACAIPRLRDAGVSRLKIVGRSRPLADKVKAVRFIHAVRERVASSPHGDIRAQAIALHQAHLGTGCVPRMCYYPAARRPGRLSRPAREAG
jgi:collagenase-like PrtC family protease